MSQNKEYNKINITEYVIEGIKSGNLIFEEVTKFQKIMAIQGEIGQTVQTILADGTIETELRKVKLDEKTNQPSWIVQNVNGPERWLVEDSTFKNKYEVDKQDPNLFKPKGGPMLAAKLSEDVIFQPPMWGGETIKVASNGFIMMDPSNAKDIYGIGQEEFAKSYELAVGSVYDAIHPTWTKEELETYFSNRKSLMPMKLEDYLKISACIGYRNAKGYGKK